MSDNIFDTPEPEIKFDRWGRYMLPDPYTHKRHPWTRATTFAKSIMDSYALNAWQQRMVAKGMSARPDLVAMASTLDVKADKSQMDSLVEQAKDSAGQKVAANTGTAIHGFTEGLDRGDLSLDLIPPAQQPDVSAYANALRSASLRVVSEMIERVICVPSFSVAGRLDRVLQEASGDYVIGDVKSGSSLQYGWLEIAIQLALYARGLNAAGVFDQAHERWDRSSTPRVRTDYAIVMHVPAGKGECTLYRVDIEAGWEAAKLCDTIRDWRKRNDLSSAYAPRDVSDVPQSISDDWETRFRSVTSKDEAAALYREAASVLGAKSKELEFLTQLAVDALNMR